MVASRKLENGLNERWNISASSDINIKVVYVDVVVARWP
jgi:hypothetical protein